MHREPVSPVRHVQDYCTRSRRDCLTLTGYAPDRPFRQTRLGERHRVGKPYLDRNALGGDGLRPARLHRPGGPSLHQYRHAIECADRVGVRPGRQVLCDDLRRCGTSLCCGVTAIDALSKLSQSL